LIVPRQPDEPQPQGTFAEDLGKAVVRRQFRSRGSDALLLINGGPGGYSDFDGKMPALQPGMRATMRKLWSAIFVLLPAIAFAQAPQDFSKVEIKVSNVSGNIYMLQGAGGNIAASLGDDGVLIVDTEYAPLADKIAAALRGIGITDKPVRFVIDTHYHDDHSNGNTAWGARGATILANENLRKRLETGSSIGNGPGGAVHIQQPAMAAIGLPTITFSEGLTLHFNGEEIRVMHFPAAHTDGDGVVYFTTNHVVHMGDEFVRYGFPFVDVNSGGSVQGMIEACEKVAAMAPADTKVIPGHGELANVDDLRAYTKMMKDTMDVVQRAMAKGETLSQIKSEKILDAWQKYSGTFVSTDAWIETIYNSLNAVGAMGTKGN
jgi:cyclase